MAQRLARRHPAQSWLVGNSLIAGWSVPLPFVQRKQNPLDPMPNLGVSLQAPAHPARRQSPDWPPCLCSNFTSPITMPRSTALHMS